MARKKKIPAELLLPTILYKSPGSNAGPEGKTYDYAPADTEDQVRSLLDRGYSLTLAEACGLSESEYEPDEVDAVVQPDLTGIPGDSPAAGRVLEAGSLAADAPPSRKELERKAKELGIDFAKGTPNGLLEQQIADALNLAEANRETGPKGKV